MAGSPRMPGHANRLHLLAPLPSACAASICLRRFHLLAPCSVTTKAPITYSISSYKGWKKQEGKQCKAEQCEKQKASMGGREDVA